MTDTAPGIGHNSGLSADRLRNIVSRAQSLANERKEIGEAIRDLFVEAKSAGFDIKVLRKVLALLAMDVEQRKEAEAQAELVDTYMDAIEK